MTELITPFYNMAADLETPRRKSILFFLDIDGFCVRSFDMHGKNQGENGEQIKNQPINHHFQAVFQKWYSTTRANIRVVVPTGRKEFLQLITEKHLFSIRWLIDKIYYYPQELRYDPPTEYHNWKLGIFKDEIAETKPDEIIIGDDDLSLLSKTDQMLADLWDQIPRTYWVAIKDQYLIQTAQIADLGTPAEVDG